MHHITFYMTSMPFTLSHAVVAPPLAYYTRLLLAGIVIGCMTPDLSRFFTPTNSHTLSILAHTWHGLIYPDLWIGLFFAGLWYLLYRPVIYYYTGLNDPLAINHLFDAVQFIFRVICAIILGTATHIIWDGLTHLDFRTFAFHHILATKIQILNQVYPLHYILQISCSIVALPILIYSFYRYYLQHREEYILSRLDKCLASTYILLPFTVASYQLYHFYVLHQKLNWYDLIGRGFNTFSFSFLITLTFLSLMILIIQYIQSD